MSARRWMRLARLCAVVLSGTVLAQTASPGPETALRRSIAEIAAGTPDYTQMTPEFANAVRQQLSMTQSLFKSWGEVKSVVFKGEVNGVVFGGGDPRGADKYAVTFEKGSAEFLITLAPDAKIAGEFVRPIGGPPGPPPT